MSASIDVTLWCNGRDGHGERVIDADLADPVTDARRYLAGRGWVYADGRDLCPSCALRAAKAQPTLDLGGAA